MMITRYFTQIQGLAWLRKPGNSTVSRLIFIISHGKILGTIGYSFYKITAMVDVLHLF